MDILGYIFVLLLGLGAGSLLLRFPGLTEKIREVLAKHGDPQYYMAGVLVLLTVTIFLLDERPVEMPVGAVREATTTIESRLQNKSSSEKANVKGQEIAKIATTFKERAQHGKADYEIEIQDINAIEGGVEVFARAWTPEGKPVGFGADGTVEIERFRIYNPPILVEDPQGDIIRTSTDRFGNSYTQTFREDTKQALLQSLAHTVGIVGKDGSNIVPGKRGNTTSTFYPNAHPESTSVDGRLKVGGRTDTWATIRAIASATNVSDNATSAEIAATFAFTVSGQWNELVRSIFLFDTSPIPDTDTISSATFSVYVTSKADPHNEVDFAVVGSTPASNTALATTDFTLGVEIGTTRYASDIAYGSISTTAYNDWSLNATGIAAVSLTGVSKFGLLLAEDLDNSSPTWSASTYKHITGNFADNSGTTNDPKLVVEHGAVAASGATPGANDIIYY